MSQIESGSPTEIFRHLLNSKFHVFLEYEANPNITASGRVITTLIRSVFAHNPRNIRTALNRVDGVLPKQVDIQLPRVYYLYPNAKQVNGRQATHMVQDEAKTQDVMERQPEEPQPARSIPEMSVREATKELGQLPYLMVENILKQANETAAWFKAKGENPPPKHTPYLKSVIAAHFVEMAANGIPDVVEDFFDSVDGRLTETIKVGQDIYLTSYESEAPDGAYLNADGILEIEATKQQQMWGRALQKGKTR